MNTHWIDYTPGGVARVTDKEPFDDKYKQTASTDVNKLSRDVVHFNEKYVVSRTEYQLKFKTL